MWRALSFLFLGLAPACAAPVLPPGLKTGEIIAFGGGPGGATDGCFTCHGLKGEGDRLAPRLAGQLQGYLVKQLEDYAARWRDHSQMSPIAARLDDGDRLAVAAYYAAQQSTPPRQAGGIPDGLQLFREGDPDRGLAPCAECHGAEGKGGGLANPRLAGQPVEYLEVQLRAWRAADRRNDPRDVMGAIARKLTDAEIGALVRYLGAAP
jgi:cytochrome c553